MAEAPLDRESLRCSICLDLFRNPAIIPCGHSFCADCIAGLWDQDVCRCPQCKQTFTHRPALIDWLQVKDLSEKLMKMRTQAEDGAEARDDGVSCDSCTSRTTKAVRSCLTCLASYCSTHLERHNELHGWRKHQLTDATDLQSKTCSQHAKLTDVFCRTDQQCVCVLCAIHEHKGHDTITASEERADRQRKLMETRVKFLQIIQDREKDFKELTQAEESIRCSAHTADTERERIFGEVLCSVQKTCCRVKELIADQQRAELSHVEGLQEKVQQKIADMKMKVSELDQFMTTEDHIHFLQNYPSDYEESISVEFEDLSSISEHPFFHNVRMLITKMQERLMDVTKATEIKIKSVKGGTSSQDPHDADVEIMFERKPTAEQAELAGRLMLPHTFFCYRNQLGDVSDEDDDEDFEEAVKSLKGKLYPGLSIQGDASAGHGGTSSQDPHDADVEIVFERKPTAEQAELAGRLMLPHTFFCYRNQLGDVSDEDDDEDFEEAVKSLKGKLYPGLSIQGDASAGHVVSSMEKQAMKLSRAVPGQDLDGSPPGETRKLLEEVLDANLPRENAGAETQSDGLEEHSDDDVEAPTCGFPFSFACVKVELPSVEENEEMMLFKEWAKLYRWDCGINKWKACGEGDIKILFHPSRKLYRAFMRQERDKKVCVNHCISRAIRLKPVNTSATAVAWRASDASEGDAVLRLFSAKFKTPQLAVSFTQTFKDCQSRLSYFMQPLKK